MAAAGGNRNRHGRTWANYYWRQTADRRSLRLHVMGDKTMRGEIIDVRDLTAGEMAAWSDLASRAVAPNPFAERDFVLPARRGLGVPDVGLLIVRRGREWRLAVPVQQRRAWHGIPGRCLSVWDHIYSFLGTPLVSDDDREAAIAALMERAGREAPAVVVDLLDAGGPLAEPLTGAMEARGCLVTLREFARPMLRRAPGDGVEMTM